MGTIICCLLPSEQDAFYHLPPCPFLGVPGLRLQGATAWRMLRCSCFSLCHRDWSCLGCLSGLVFCRRDPWLHGECDRCHRLQGLCLRGSVLPAILYLGGALLDLLNFIVIFARNKEFL